MNSVSRKANLIFAVATLAWATPALSEDLRVRECFIRPLLQLFTPFPLPFFVELTLDRSVSKYFDGLITVKKRQGLARLRPNNFKPLIQTLDRLMGKTAYVGSGINVNFMKTLSPGKKYTFVLKENKFIFSETHSHWVNDLLSKHRTMAGEDDLVHFAGEMWLDDRGRLVISNASGTYKPKAELLPNVKAFFEDYYGIQNIQLVPH